MRRLVVLKKMPVFEGGILLDHRNFTQAKQFLGQEHPFVVYDMRAEGGICLNLDALAIAAGTICANGTLYLLCPEWDSLERQIDFDSLRWNGNKAITCPLFYRHFKSLVERFGFDVQNALSETITNGPISTKFCKFTAEQQHIFDTLPFDSASIHLITAPRGRGKSTLAGKLAQRLAETDSVIITARSHSALPNFWQAAESERVKFYAPDKLLRLIDDGLIEAEHVLFIDEAASLPLPFLQRFCDYFEKTVLTTTTHNYEGTGRGFSLKLPKQFRRPYKEWRLSEPLRWAESDPLERFIDELLLLNEADPLSHKDEAGFLEAFYRLLAEAHYKTTPTDLRRLFDADGQILRPLCENNELIGGIWAVAEGGLSEALSLAVWRGERRPQGNLAAQYLCFQGNLPEACRLRSVRISRIAVLPERQRQGIGKRLISDFILQNFAEKRPLADYLSVSFGMTDALLNFWRRCGFRLVQITPHKEAGSGCRSAIMLYPLSERGTVFVQEAVAMFERDLALQPFFPDLQNFAEKRPLADDKLSAADWRNLHGFAFDRRTFSACFVSLTRLWRARGLPRLPVKPSKVEIQLLKQVVADKLMKEEYEV